MNKVEKNKERLSQIKKERMEMLKNVKNELRNNNKDLSKDIKTILKLLDFDEKNIKKYENLSNAKEIVTNLIKEIINSKSDEEIKETRKKLNYYINKIKREMLKRNINEDISSNYNTDVKILRKNISKYIRFLKRKQNIVEIEKLNRSYKKLSKEEKKELSKKLALEKRYNKKYLNGKNDDDLKLTKSIEEKDEKESIDDLKIIFINDEEIKETENKENQVLKHKPYMRKSINTVECLSEKIYSYNFQYGMNELDEYGNSSIKNLIVFLKNIKKCMSNKRKIKFMKYDSENYYSGTDFLGYIEYIKEQNSLKYGLKNIFKKTTIFSRQSEYLTNHERCVYWVMNYCNNNSLDYETTRNEEIVCM